MTFQARLQVRLRFAFDKFEASAKSKASFHSLQVCVTFVFGALLEYALVNYASRSDAQRLAKKKVQKQWEIDHCSFDPAHMEDALPNNGGGSFAMVCILIHLFTKYTIDE